MFHVKDGLWVERCIGASYPGYSWQEQIDKFFTIKVFVTELDTARIIDQDDGRIKDNHRQKIIYKTEITVEALASKRLLMK